MQVPNPPRRRRTRRTPPGLIALVASLVLHGVGFVALLAVTQMTSLLAPAPLPKPKPVQAVGIQPITADDWEKNRGRPPKDEQKIARAPKLREEQQQKKKEPEKLPQGQVVDTAPGNNEEDPEAKYLAESSNKTQKETKAKEQDRFYRNAAPRRTSPVAEQGAGADNVEKPQVKGNHGAGDDDRPLRDESERKLTVEIPDIRARDEVRLQEESADGPGPMVANRQESAEVRGNSEKLRLQEGAPSEAEDGSRGKAGAPAIATLTPSLSVLDKVYGAAPNDHLDDVDEGDGTYLNTREWKYASFFNRVKQSINMTWDPGRELRVRDPTGNVYAGRDRHTLLSVTLDERGRVKDVFVVKSSGLDFLDLEAVQSFERAQPFPNPPPGLLTTASTVTFNFGFFVEMGGGPRIQLFR